MNERLCAFRLLIFIIITFMHTICFGISKLTTIDRKYQQTQRLNGLFTLFVLQTSNIFLFFLFRFCILFESTSVPTLVSKQSTDSDR